ncbi:MAG: DegT/DnrJ/EryC1/StrS family aminotransferase [Caldimonas sp.]
MIRMNDFAAEPDELREAMLAAAARVFSSGWYVLGRECETFESTWAAACDVACCTGVGNGLDAIELILRALDIGAGDEVVTTGMTAVATVLAISRAGATPVLADVEPGTALLDPASVERCLSARTRAIVVVHLYGQARQMDAWVDLCTRRGLALIEDCAQAHLARWSGRGVGSFGVAGAFSFYPTKNLGAVGDAGAVVSHDVALNGRVARLRNYGQSERYVHPELGMNSRLDELQAAILLARLPWLEGFTQQRRRIAERYDDEIRHAAVRKLLPAESAEAHVHHLYAVCVADRDGLIEHLARRGVQSLIHYPIPVHRQAPFLSLKTDPQGLRCTEAHAATCLSLPCHPQLSNDDIDRTIAAVNSFQHR